MGTIGGAALRGGLQGGGTALAGEGVGAAFGDDFDAGQVAQATATGAAMGGAKQVAQEGFAGLKDSMGIGAPDTAGDSLTPSEQFEGAQGQFGGQQGMEGTGQFTSDTPQYDLNVGGIEGAGIYEPSGAGMIGGIGAPQGNIGDEMAPLTVEPVGPTPGVARPAMMPWGHTALQTTPQGTAQVTPLTSGNVEATLGPDVVGMATDMGSFFDPYSDIGAAEADFGEEIARQKGLDTTVSPLAGTAESGLMGGAGIEGPLQPGRWAEQPAVDEGINYQSLLGGFSGLASGLFGGETSGGGGGAQTSRQAQDLGVDTSEAGQEDPVSALQIQSTGMASLNPALFNWVGGDDPQEMKKRVQMWQNNPNITDF